MSEETMTIEYGLGDYVIVVPINVPGRIVAIMIDQHGIQYLTRYWDDGQPNTNWIFQNELEPDKNKE